MNDSRLDSVREWYRNQTTPEHVEKASRRERWKRDAWLIGSSMLTLAAATGLVSIPVLLYTSIHPHLVGVITFAVWMVADIRVHQWGVDRFDLVRPWQFRDAEHEEGGET